MEPVTRLWHSDFLRGNCELQYNPGILPGDSGGAALAGSGSKVFADTAMYPGSVEEQDAEDTAAIRSGWQSLLLISA